MGEGLEEVEMVGEVIVKWGEGKMLRDYKGCG